MVQTVLIYGSEIWIRTYGMLKVLEEFHHQVAWRIAGLSNWRIGKWGWEWSLVAEALEAAGLWPMKEYIWRRQDTIVECIVNHPIYEL